VTNLASNYYTQSFTLITTSDQIKNITAWDSIGQITPETEIKSSKNVSSFADKNPYKSKASSFT